ncbi:MAG: PQQ-like beta-propeller repeat protein [Pirellulales bacterium]|nr:PQQ-like beta-propeller repeat protein [Pirellulales bacterium]
MRLLISAALVVSGSTSLLAAELDTRLAWPSWRGPGQAGSTDKGSYVAEFGAEKNVLWKVKLPGIGCSTPAVDADNLFLTCPAEGEDAVLCYDWSGKERWQTKIGADRGGKHRNGSGSNPSPVADGKYVFAYFRSGNLAGLDYKGNLLWKTNLQKRFAKDTLYWDLGTSPVLTKSLVIVAVMHSGESYLAAFDKPTGELKWKVTRNYKTPVEGDHSYATPHVVTQDGKEVLVVWGAERVTAHSVADGSLLWSCGGFNPDEKRNWVVVGSSVVADDIAVVPYGRGSRLAGIKLSGEGDVTETNRLWTRKDTGSFVPTPSVHKGMVYLLRDKGEVECIDPKTGETQWKGEFPRRGSAKFYASPVIADGKMFAPREDGIVLVASVDGKFEFLSSNDMGERVIASPVPVGDRMLIRGEEHLFCIGR